ncbi:MAG: 2-C-methyl-D-erythritol 4-phosphate cytidylyltransferase [Muribaculaceae bacterium]|nr:2-C-methyl-D-erythritol 4-phosphate cytidylyltransferase [Muribaculaceae bacterium]
MRNNDDVRIIIVAGGTGSRFGGDCPKQYCQLAGRPVVMHTIDAFRRGVPSGEIVLVISEAMQGLWDSLCEEHRFESPRVVYGGSTRWESVKNGLETLMGLTPSTVVLVHDAARPIVSDDMVERVIAGARESDGAIPVVAVTDSLRIVGEGGSSSVDRGRFRAVQTPQGFPAMKLKEAYGQAYSASFTDDASVMESAGYDNLTLVEGDIRTMKITNPNDIKIAELILNS